MSINDATSLVPIIKKIPVFDGLSPSEIKMVLKLCAQKSYQPGQTLCSYGTPSDEMYILLSGRLRVLTADGLQVGVIQPVTTVGEMGVVTGQPRSATVDAAIASNALAIRRTPLEQTLRNNKAMELKLLRNLTQILSSKIVTGNLAAHDRSVQLE